MIDLEYLKRSKEEIKQMIALFGNFSESSFSNMLFHMQKSMLFMADALAGRHVDLLTEYSVIREKTQALFGSEFFENYFLINNLMQKKIRMLSHDKIIVTGKNSYNLDKQYFKELASTIIKYYNTIYLRVENNGF